jgi:enterochelin esterase family protein
MGGFGALRLAFAQPFRFGAAASFSGALWAGLKPDTAMGGARAEYIFHGAFGRPFDARRFLAESPMTTMHSLIGAADPPAVFLTVGDKDRYKLYEDTFELFMSMHAAGLPVEMRMTGGDHSWETWAEELPEALRFFDHAFRRGE